jgi:hypothetical protein
MFFRQSSYSSYRRKQEIENTAINLRWHHPCCAIGTGRKLCVFVAVLTQLYLQKLLEESAACFGPLWAAIIRLNLESQRKIYTLQRVLLIKHRTSVLDL